jgi:hypothetical protein
MKEDEIERILRRCLAAANPPYDRPSRAEWMALERRFSTKFPASFVGFMNALTGFEFPGDIYNVAESKHTNGNDGIVRAYESQLEDPQWPRWFVPFYGIGNGDYFGLDSRAETESSVYYWYHEQRKAKSYCASFDEWLCGLEEFLE